MHVVAVKVGCRMLFPAAVRPEPESSVSKIRGRHGFDVGIEPSCACRGAENLVKPAAKPIVANDDNYALAA